MTINEKKQLTNYIKNLVRENIKKEKYPKDFKWEKEPREKEIQKALWDGWDEQDKRNKEADKQWKESGAKDYDEWKKEKQLKEHIKKLVKEAISGEMPSFYTNTFGPNPGLDDEDESGFHDDGNGFENNEIDIDEPEEGNDFWEEMGESGRHYEGPDVDGNDDPVYDDEEDDDDIAGINELRKLAESYARQAVSNILSESKSKKKKRKNKKEKTSSKDKTVVSQLNADGTNAAHYYYKLYGVENGTEAEKAAARSKGYKKAKGKKNDTGVPYKFSSKERNRLSSLLTDRS